MLIIVVPLLAAALRRAGGMNQLSLFTSNAAFLLHRGLLIDFISDDFNQLRVNAKAGSVRKA